jgi:hypothetical protein
MELAIVGVGRMGRNEDFHTGWCDPCIPYPI